MIAGWFAQFQRMPVEVWGFRGPQPVKMLPGTGTTIVGRAVSGVGSVVGTFVVDMMLFPVWAQAAPGLDTSCIRKP